MQEVQQSHPGFGWIIALALISFGTFAQAQSSEITPTPIAVAEQLPEPIAHLSNQGIEVLESFHVSAMLVGWVISFDGQDMIVYTTADGRHLINGQIMDAQGQDLTQLHQMAHLPGPGWSDLDATGFITEPSLRVDDQGQVQTLSQIYVFFDTHCPFCHLAWLALQPYREAGLEVRWIPVAYVNPDSRNRAAALWEADDPVELLAAMMTDPEAQMDEFDQTLAAYHREQLQANMSLMQALGLNGTPGWLWLDEQGEMQRQAGMPRLPRLPEITGLPEQRINHPDLVRFR